MKISPTLVIFFFVLCLRSLAQPDLKLITIATGFSSPVSMANAGDGSDRLFVVERNGIIKIISDIPNGTVLGTPFLDISSLVESGGEKGLLGLAFHPGYPDTPYFCVNYTFREAGLLKTKVERYTVSADPNVADANTALQILEVVQPQSNHNAGDISFGQDRYLYITMGDGGVQRDTDNDAQSGTSLLGGMLRVDIFGDDFPGDTDANYSIPANNPFVGVAGFRDEIWSLGLRNPWRASFDRQTQDLWIADVGFGSREEISFQSAASTGGENYGWSCREGTVAQPFNPCIPGPLTDPIFEYPRNEGSCVIGGYVYRGTAFPGLFGFYVFADYGSGNFWIINSTNFNDVTKFSIMSNISCFGESDSGELYTAHLGSGTIYRVFDLSACEDVVTITDHNDTVYSADSLLISTIPVGNGSEILYSSPRIHLDPNFEVADNGLFSSQNLSCQDKILMEKI